MPPRIASVSAPRPSRATAVPLSARSGASDMAVVKQGPLLYFSPDAAEYVRCYVTLTHGGFSFQIHGGARSRPLRPRLLLSSIRNIFAETSAPPAPRPGAAAASATRASPPRGVAPTASATSASPPQSVQGASSPQRAASPEATEPASLSGVDLHYYVIVLETATEAVVVRSTDRETIASWISVVEETVPERTIRRVSEMPSALRGHFPPQLDSQLFPRTQLLLAAGRNPKRGAVPPPQGTHAIRTRMASQSAMVPQRRSVVGRALGFQLPLHRGANSGNGHVDPSIEQDLAERRRRSVLVVEPSSTVRSRSISPQARRSISPQSLRLAPAAGSPRSARDAASSARMSPLHSPKERPDILRRALDESRAALFNERSANEKMKVELEDANRRCVEYELDATNSAVRVLELESDVRMLKNGIAEWRRRYQSLEQQLQTQEDSFAARLRAEKQEQLDELQAQVAAHWEGVTKEWRTREAALTAEINDLKEGR
jgi:hypothetical protein